MIDARVAIVGAGPSGLASCQVLAQRGIPFDCFEKGSDVGGLWRYENDNALASAYASLHLNTSRETARYASYPMPEHYPDFPHHTQMLAYLEDYVEHFGLRDSIRYRTEVTAVEPLGETWEVRWRESDGATASARYTAVLVASGHHWEPRRLDLGLPGTFVGVQLHSHLYRTAEAFADKNVLVVGIGDSAMDIACDISQASRMTFLTARRGAWIVPKYLGGAPLGEVTAKLQSRLPSTGEVASGTLFNIGRPIFARRIERIHGRPQDHGLPEPDHEFGAGMPTVSAEIFTRIGLGHVTPKPWISRFDGERVHFQDGSVEGIDAIVYCTGYEIVLPFLAADVLDPKDKALPLYRRVVHPDRPGLYFIGLIDVGGPLNPLSELQAEWVADLLQGRLELPARAQMKRRIAREERRRQKRFGAGTRYAIYVDYVPYLQALRRERGRRGRRSAPVAPRPKATHPEETHSEETHPKESHPEECAHASQRNPVTAGAGASGLEGSPSGGEASL
jgi:cation diffusion facilitator CzcD-associated flavoprotein CzcO